jgi:hypothetical protein
MRRIARLVIGILSNWESCSSLIDWGFVIVLSTRLGSQGHIPVFSNLEVIFFGIKACFHAGRKRLQKDLLDMETMPKLLNINVFSPFV